MKYVAGLTVNISRTLILNTIDSEYAYIAWTISATLKNNLLLLPHRSIMFLYTQYSDGIMANILYG